MCAGTHKHTYLNDYKDKLTIHLIRMVYLLLFPLLLFLKLLMLRIIRKRQNFIRNCLDFISALCPKNDEVLLEHSTALSYVRFNDERYELRLSLPFSVG